MFQWDKAINAINIPAAKVVHLFRSMRDVQLALPGVSAQQGSAFLCQYRVDDGVATVAVFHLHKSKVLSFYFSDPRIVPEQKIDSMLDQGLNFVESMGFLMTDQDIHLLDVPDQEMLWSSLPIKTGLADDEVAPLSEVSERPLPAQPSSKLEADKNNIAAEQREIAPAVSGRQPVKEPAPAIVPEKARAKVESKAETAENVDELLAAVEAMRAKRPGLRARKSAPSTEEMARRRLLLRETVGRILASL